jgi:hypothetical protein
MSPADIHPWLPAPTPLDEHERLRRLFRLGVGEGQHHEFLDTITALAASIVKSPISVVSLVEENRQFFLSRHGLGADQTGRAESFCGHCVQSHSALVVGDAHADPRFASNPLVTGAPYVRAYFGVPLFAGLAQSAIGTLCVIDQAPRVWTTEQQGNIARLGVRWPVWSSSLWPRACCPPIARCFRRCSPTPPPSDRAQRGASCASCDCRARS